VDDIRSAGVDQLGLLTDQRQENPAASPLAPKPLPSLPAQGQ
jgi:hypothetical protein